MAYDDHGDPFWSFVQEIFSINHWDDIIPHNEAEAVLLAMVPEAQSLMRELLQRGLVFITRTHGFPPPSSGQFAVTEEEVEGIILDTQNWMGPIGEGPSAIYYSFCSAISAESITEDNIGVLCAKVGQPNALSQQPLAEETQPAV